MNKMIKDVKLETVSQSLLNKNHFIFNLSYPSKGGQPYTNEYETIEISGGFNASRLLSLKGGEINCIYASHGMADVDVKITKDGLLYFYYSPIDGVYDVFELDKESSEKVFAAFSTLVNA